MVASSVWTWEFRLRYPSMNHCIGEQHGRLKLIWNEHATLGSLWGKDVVAIEETVEKYVKVLLMIEGVIWTLTMVPLEHIYMQWHPRFLTGWCFFFLINNIVSFSFNWYEDPWIYFTQRMAVGKCTRDATPLQDEEKKVTDAWQLGGRLEVVGGHQICKIACLLYCSTHGPYP